jgi:flagellar operon protein
MIQRTQGSAPPGTTPGIGPERSTRVPNGGTGTAASFEEVLHQQRIRQQARQAQQPQPAPVRTDGSLTFSKHAQQRLQAREIQLMPEQNRRLESAVHSAASRGSRQSMVVLDGMAFIVNVQERTVVTALNAGHGSNTVVTNIDSAVVA